MTDSFQDNTQQTPARHELTLAAIGRLGTYLQIDETKRVRHAMNEMNNDENWRHLRMLCSLEKA